MQHKPPDEVRQASLIAHRVRERCVCLPEGEERHVLSVFCETREQSLSLEQCGRCRHFARVDTGGPDLVMRCRPPGGGLALAHVSVSEVMAHRVHCVRQDVTCARAQAYLFRHGLNSVPVVDDNGWFQGMVRASDLGSGHPLAWVAVHLRVKVASIGQHASLAQAAARIAHERLDVLPVIDAEGVLIGVLRPLDVVSWWAREQGFVLDAEPSA